MDMTSGSPDLSIRRAELEHIRPVGDKEHPTTDTNGHNKVDKDGSSGHRKEKKEHHEQESEFDWLDSESQSNEDGGEDHILDLEA